MNNFETGWRMFLSFCLLEAKNWTNLAENLGELLDKTEDKEEKEKIRSLLVESISESQRFLDLSKKVERNFPLTVVVRSNVFKIKDDNEDTEKT